MGFLCHTVNDLAALPIYTPAHTPILANTSTPSLTTTFTPTGTLNTTTPTPTGTLNTPTATTTGACTFVSLAPPNNTEIKTDNLYVDLVWIVKNTGTTTWDRTKVSYMFRKGSGTNLHDVEISNLALDITPGNPSTLLLDIKPQTVGTHTETWDLVENGKTLCSMTLTVKFINP